MLKKGTIYEGSVGKFEKCISKSYEAKRPFQKIGKFEIPVIFGW